MTAAALDAIDQGDCGRCSGSNESGMRGRSLNWANKCGDDDDGDGGGGGDGEM